MELTSTIVSSPEDETAADRYLAGLPDGLVFVFQVGTTWKTKLWYTEGWSELARRITARWPGSTILINWGSPDEKALAELIVSEVGDSVRLLPWLRIRELIPVLRRVDLVIGGDTGPVYLAAAVGTPTVSYYRATSAATYAPRGKQHRAVQADMECTACYRTSCDRDQACRIAISVDSLFDAIVQLID
jgi:heptosyltransferase-1